LKRGTSDGAPRRRNAAVRSPDAAALQFHVVSFEGPDDYARAGGLASRVDGLTRSLASLGFETHLWFVGDPDLPGSEVRGDVRLHRWCQWLSQGCRGGVYEGEEAKERDYTASLPPRLLETCLAPHTRRGGDAVVLAEEWHTSRAIVELDRQLRVAGLRERVAMLWNANNLFGFERISWPDLTRAAVVTSVSRFMRHRMESLGVSPLVLANGLPPEAYKLPNPRLQGELRTRFTGRLALTKVARWDPDKAWLSTIRGVAHLRDQGLRPLLIARGGAEAHEAEVRAAVAAAGLRWADRKSERRGAVALVDALRDVDEADVVCLRFPLDAETLRALYRSSDAVLANSRFEPFGLVGLEAMAVGGVACTGLSGEDYAVPGRNALVIQTDDPRELGAVLERLRAHPEEEKQLRAAARVTARQYAWTEIVKRVLLPRLELLRGPRSEDRRTSTP
jgi:glycosyltransferase involved in cell wall biosynthesis